jgi:ubiquinone/menaquinone biosynthesis C-methylase UbiE
MFHDLSYARHAEHHGAALADPDRKRLAAAWFDASTADSWRNLRAYEAADYLGHVPGERWLTIGDGRFGLDAIRLRRRGVASVLPTDIGAQLLESAKNDGLIEDYGVENAERLSFADGAFDYAYCKESFHHFPRPMLALYEMLRVAKKGVILFEPNDRAHSPIRRLVRVAKRLSRRPASHIDASAYEDSGNYVYTVSPREIEKVALGIDLPQICFKGFNDWYVAGLEFEPADRARSKLYRKMRLIIAFRDLLCSLGLDVPMALMACLLKERLPAETRARMEANGWRVVDLPRNPYTTESIKKDTGER